MLRELDSAELSLWMAYDQHYGLPDPNVATARLQATFIGNKAVGPLDLLPEAYRPRPVSQSPRVMRETFRSLTNNIPRKAPP